MPDICDLILDDHETFRRRFAELDENHSNSGALGLVWEPLSALLDVHAAAEEEVFYPQLLRRGADGDEETTDAIKDHNKIRDAVARAAAAALGSEPWWHAVRAAREENSDHMAEEERGALSDFRVSTDRDFRAKLGAQFVAFKERHAGGRDLVVEDHDPRAYIAEHDQQG